MQTFHLRMTFLAAVAAAACGDDDGGSANQPPQVSAPDLTTLEDTPVTGTITVSDPEGKTLEITITGPGHGTVIRDGLSYTYSPEPDYNGSDTLTIVVSDGELAATADVAISVAPLNDPPIGHDDALATDEDAALDIDPSTLLANDADADGDALTISAVGNPSSGTVAIMGDDVRFVPSPNFAGDASFEYTVSDGAASDIVAVAITVGGENDAPVAGDDAATVTEDQPLTIPVATLLANDTDAEGQTLSLTDAAGATHGSLQLLGTDVIFTPDPDYNGSDSFDYSVSDGAASDIGTVTLTITPVNDAPVAIDDAASATQDTPLVMAPGTLLANDTDIDSATLMISGVANAVHGTVSLSVTGEVTFTADAGFTGTASFEYTVSDGDLDDIALVTVSVVP